MWGVGISGAKGRGKRPGLDAAAKEECCTAPLRRSDDLGGRPAGSESKAAVTTALAELELAGAAIYADRGGMDATTPHGKAMLQMAVVFAELERAMVPCPAARARRSWMAFPAWRGSR